MTTRPTLFSGQFLERRAELRDDPQWMGAARSDPDTRYVLGAGAAQLVTSGGSIEIAFLTGSDPLKAMLSGLESKPAAPAAPADAPPRS